MHLTAQKTGRLVMAESVSEPVRSKAVYEIPAAAFAAGDFNEVKRVLQQLALRDELRQRMLLQID